MANPDRMSQLAMLLLLLSAVTPVVAGVYKWVDENGQVHYGERPPMAGEAKRMTLEPAPPPDPGATERAERIQLDNGSWREEKARRAEEQARAKQDEELRKRNCAAARGNLTIYQTSGRVFHINEQGERQYVEDQNRAAAEQRARERVDKWCR